CSLLQASLDQVKIGQHQLRGREVSGIKRNGLAQMKFCFRKIPRLDVAHAQLRVCKCVFRRPSYSSLVDFKRLLVLAQGKKRASQVYEWRVRAWIFLQCTSEMPFGCR